jgi:hypothetical protein
MTNYKVIIEKNSNNIWTAAITPNGFPSIGKAFYKKEDAENWVKEIMK